MCRGGIQHRGVGGNLTLVTRAKSGRCRGCKIIVGIRCLGGGGVTEKIERRFLFEKRIAH